MRSVAEAAAAHDAGALAFGLPLLEDEGDAPLAERRALVRLARDYDSGAAMTYWREGGGGHFRAPRSLVGARHGAAARPEVPLPPLRVELDGRLSRAEVSARRRDEPEIWSDVPDGAKSARSPCVVTTATRDSDAAIPFGHASIATLPHAPSAPQ